MSTDRNFKKKQPPALDAKAQAAIDFIAFRITPGAPLLPLGALLLAGSMGALAQTPAAGDAATLPTVTVKDAAIEPEGKQSLKPATTRIGKTQQELRDVPQSITVVTEKLIDDRNLDTLKDTLKSTGGISFLAAEGAEEDIRLRGFSLATSGDIYVDGLRDPAFYDRDMFAVDRIEVLRGSASMLFGRGSTGGVVNQAMKTPRLIDQHEVTVTGGNHGYFRTTGDFNLKTGENAALRLNAMVNRADNNGTGGRIDKHGLAATYRLGIGTRDEFSAGVYYLNNRNGINYGLPWIRPNASSPVQDTTTLPLDPSRYYGLASDRNHGSAAYLTLSHLHRFDHAGELRTTLRTGRYERDLRPSTIRLCRQMTNAQGVVINPQCPTAVSLENFGPGTILTRGAPLKIQNLNNTVLQSDYSGKFQAGGLKHELLAGVELVGDSLTNFSASTPPGVNLGKPTTTVGTPNDGAWIDEGARVLTPGRTFKARSVGVYAQDLVELTPQWKLLGGLRYDYFKGRYWQAAAGTNPAAERSRSDGVWSKRLGVIYQPSETQSYHMAWGTSFNTSGDTYQYDPLGANTPPEGSENFELGARFDSADKRYTTRVAAFYAIKKNERNRDPDDAAQAYLLSGKRHAAGLEFDFAGRITPRWEVFASYAFIPWAKIDKGAPSTQQSLTGELQGQRPSLTPRHSGTVWTTYALTPQWRVGGGINFRSKQSPNRNPGWNAKGFVTADLMAEYTVNDWASLKFNVSNVTNRRYADALYTGHYTPGAGRLYMLSASFKF